GPARAEHDRHVAGRRLHRFEVHVRLTDGLAREPLREAVVDDEAVVPAPAAAGIALLATAVLLDDHRDVQPDERADVGREHTVRRADQHELVDAGETADDLDHARVELADIAIEMREQLDLTLVVEGRQRIDCRIEPAPADRRCDLHAAFTAALRDAARRLRGVEQRFGIDLVRIREAGLLADDRAHADALVDAEHAFLDLAVLDGPAFVARALEVEIGVIELTRHELAHRAVEHGEVEPGGL